MLPQGYYYVSYLLSLGVLYSLVKVQVHLNPYRLRSVFFYLASRCFDYIYYNPPHTKLTVSFDPG